MIRHALHRLVEPLLGLKAKACLVLTVIVVVTAATVGGTSLYRTRAHMLRAAATQMQNTAELIAVTTQDAHIGRDTPALASLCQDLISEESLLYAAFVDGSGRVVAAAQKPGTLSTLLDDSGQYMKAPLKPTVQVRRLPGDLYGLEAVVSIKEKGGAREADCPAMLMIAGDLQPLRAELAATVQRVIELTSAVAIGVIVVGFFVVHGLVRPVNDLADAAIDLAYKHEFRRLPARGGDEVGRLTQAFNHMAERLLRTQKELLDLNSELEKRVALRTVELEARNKQLDMIASKDPLTGLYNRRAFNEMLEKEMAEAIRYKQEIACMMIDLDNFKQVNDVKGHQAGDEVLKQVARIISQEVRQSDITARFGGDEFVVLLPQCNALQAFHLARRVREVAKEALAGLNADGPAVTLSIGIADLHTSRTKTGDALIRTADQALYRVKGMGKDGICAARCESAVA